jgi:hypothetical protein
MKKTAADILLTFPPQSLGPANGRWSTNGWGVRVMYRQPM